jgi:hypothetical protein
MYDNHDTRCHAQFHNFNFRNIVKLNMEVVWISEVGVILVISYRNLKFCVFIGHKNMQRLLGFSFV